MIEIRNLQLPLSGGEASGVAYDPVRLRDACARRLRCDPSELGACAVVRRAVDARKRGDVHFVATVRVGAADGSPASELRLVERAASNDVVAANPPAYEPPVARHPAERRPVVVGAGAAGLFCALSLAEAGLAPVLIERGSDPVRRVRDVERFVATGELDVESNIQFGAGGAGTFSDGKHTTGTSSQRTPGSPARSPTPAPRPASCGRPTPTSAATPCRASSPTSSSASSARAARSAGGRG